MHIIYVPTYVHINGVTIYVVKGTVMQIDKALINDCLRVSKIS